MAQNDNRIIRGYKGASKSASTAKVRSDERQSLVRRGRDRFRRMNAHRERTNFGNDKRRKRRHWMTTIFYRDGERFARTYTDREKATAFAERQRKSPVVKMARVAQVS
jgi:hypothetical protein